MRLIDADALYKDICDSVNEMTRLGIAVDRYYLWAKINDALENASTIEPEQKWIPCSDPSDLPKDKRLWITREISDGFFTLREVSDVIWDMTEWSGSVSNVVAYMPYWEPEPYTERREE